MTAPELPTLSSVLAESAPDPIITIDEHSTILSVNPAAERVFGYAAAELLGRSLHLLIPERLRARHDRGVARYLATGTRHIAWQGVRMPVRTRSGAELPVEISFGEFVTDGRRVFSGFMRDISAQTTAEQRLAAAAAEQSALLAAEHAARTRAELAADRASRLQLLAGTLSQASTAETVAEAAVHAGAGAVGAAAGSLALLDRGAGAFTIVAALGYPAHVLARFQRFPVDDRRPLSHAVHTVQPVFLESLADAEREFPDVAADLRQTGYESYVALPIIAGGTPVGGLSLSFRDARAFDESERRFLLTLASLAGQALERARLFDAERRAREEAERAEHALAFLAEASGALAESLDYRETLDRVAHLAVPRLADWCTVDVLSEAGEIELVALAHANPRQTEVGRRLRLRYPPRADRPSGLAHVIRTGEPELVPEITQELLEASAPDAEQRAAVRALGLRSYLCVPMTARGRTLGAISLLATTDSDRRYGPPERALAMELARRAALAVDNARLYAEAERARREAEAANRTKTAFLATMSHELRTPLNAIGGYAQLLDLGIRGPVSAAQREDLARIQRSQRHLLTLVNDVLDYARVEAGASELQVEDVPLQEVLGDLETLVRPQVDARGLGFLTCAVDPAVTVRADRARLLQVLANLLSNSIKFTPAGGQVAVECEVHAETVQVRVVDTGIGISPDQLERIFQPFTQAHEGLTRTAEGAGLGLAISRDLARGMGGELRAESAPGAGTTMRLTLVRGGPHPAPTG